MEKICMRSKTGIIRENERLKKRAWAAEARAGALKQEGRQMKKRLEKLEYGIATEWCGNCEEEIELVWNVDVRGFKAFCPVCGARLMLCDECQHRKDGEYTDDCDYDAGTDTCRFNPAERKGGKRNGKS